MLSRKSALVEAGASEEEVEELLASFADTTDEMFEQVVVLAKKGFVPFKKKDDKEDEEDKDTEAEVAEVVEEVTEAEAEETDEAADEAEAEVLENVEEEAEASLTDAGDDSIEELRTSASAWLESNVLRSTASLNK